MGRTGSFALFGGLGRFVFGFFGGVSGTQCWSVGTNAGRPAGGLWGSVGTNAGRPAGETFWRWWPEKTFGVGTNAGRRLEKSVWRWYQRRPASRPKFDFQFFNNVSDGIVDWFILLISQQFRV